MPSLIIKVSGQPDAHFPIRQPEVVIGRGEAADLLLPNVSVSRKHARVSVQEDRVFITDLESANGTVVNGERVQSQELANGDELRIGKFSMTFLGDNRGEQVWNGRFIGYLPLYDPDYVRSGGDTTFQLDPATLKRMQQEALKLDSARICLVLDSRAIWNPGDAILSFGEGGDVKVEGRFTSGIAAVVSWNGRSHVLEKKGRFTKVEINDLGINAQALKHGDLFQVGDTRFRYELPTQ